jgi:hypothetical protein
MRSILGTEMVTDMSAHSRTLQDALAPLPLLPSGAPQPFFALRIANLAF